MRPEPVDPEQHDVPDTDPRKPDSDATKRVRISTKRPDPGELNEGVPKKLRFATKQSRPLLDDDGNRVRTARGKGKASRDSCCGGSRGIRFDARAMRKLGDVHRAERGGIGFARAGPRDDVV